MRKVKYIPPKAVQFAAALLFMPIVGILSQFKVFNTDWGTVYGISFVGIVIIYLIVIIRADILNFLDRRKLNQLNKYNSKMMYSEKDFDRAFMMLNDLSKGKKPGFFSYPQYKSLFNHPLKSKIIHEYNKYFEDLPNMDDQERLNRATKLANFIF